MCATDAATWLELQRETTAANAEPSSAEQDSPSCNSLSRSPKLIPSRLPNLPNILARTTASRDPQTATSSAEPARVRVGRFPSSMTRDGLENVFRWAEGLLGVELNEENVCGYASFASVFDARQAMATREGLSGESAAVMRPALES